MIRCVAGDANIATPPRSGTDRLLTDREAAELLCCGRSTLWRWAADGVIPKPIKIGGMSRWRHSDIQSVVIRAVEQREVA